MGWGRGNGTGAWMNTFAEWIAKTNEEKRKHGFELRY